MLVGGSFTSATITLKARTMHAEEGSQLETEKEPITDKEDDKNDDSY